MPDRRTASPGGRDDRRAAGDPECSKRRRSNAARRIPPIFDNARGEARRTPPCPNVRPPLPPDAPAAPPGRWSGRFGEPVAERVKRYTASVGFDQRLAQVDIAGSRAHARMLAAQRDHRRQRISPTIERGLDAIAADIARGPLRMVARPRGRASQHRAPADRAHRRRRQAAAHGALAQRPGRDRRAAVAARRDRRLDAHLVALRARAARSRASGTATRSCRASRICRSRSR